MLTFFIAGLLYLLCLEHVDNLGAYTASRRRPPIPFPKDSQQLPKRLSTSLHNDLFAPGKKKGPKRTVRN